MIKSIVVARRKQGMSREEFQKYWKETHGPLAAKYMTEVRRYVQNHVIEMPGMEFNADGIVEMWYDDIDSYLRQMEYISSDEGKFLRDDGDSFSDIDPSNVWIVEEHVIK